MKYNKDLRGSIISVNAEGRSYTNEKYDADFVIGYLTGYYNDAADDFFYEYIPSPYEIKKFGFDEFYLGKEFIIISNKKIDLDKYISEVTRNLNGGKQNVVNQTINNNKQIQENLLIAAKIITDGEQFGVAVPIDIRNRLFTLQNRLTQRNVDIQNSGLVEKISVGTSPNFQYISELQSFMNKPGIGIAPIVYGYIIVSALISYTAVSIAWKIFESKYLPESVKDVKLSNELLTDMKNQLKPQTWEQFSKEYEKMLLKIAELEKKLKSNSLTGILKIVGFSFIGIYAVDKFIMSNRINN